MNVWAGSPLSAGEMKISAVIPAHNAARWLPESLKSVAAQSLPPHEVIVVNDASSDDTEHVARAHPVVTSLLTTQHGNGAASRNAGIDAATGDWIAFLDADDLWYPNHLQRVSELLEGTRDVGCLCLADHVYADADQPIQRRQTRWPYRTPTTGLSHWDFIEHYSQNLSFDMSGIVARRDVLLEIGKLDAELPRRHDIDMWLRVIGGRTWVYDPVPSSAYRIDTPGAISRKIANREYYFLRVMLKNRDLYRCPAMDRLIRVAARRAVSAAFTDGDASDRAQVLRLAKPHLSPKDTWLFRVFSACPPLFALLNRARRGLRRNRRSSTKRAASPA